MPRDRGVLSGNGMQVSPPQSWRSASSHLRTVLSDPWYKGLVALLHRINLATHEFYSGRGLTAVSLPVTTGSISSPMGLGSDSMPVEVELMGVKTYLADSAQFMLEVMCRITDGGAYYLMPSFRGEATDETHLAQFYHSEIEIPGELPDVMAMSEDYVRALSSAMLDHHADFIRLAAGGTGHVESLLSWSGPLPSIRHEDALRSLQGDTKWLTTLSDGTLTVSRAGEAELTRRFGANGSVLWITHFDRTAVPFYQAAEPGTPYALNADLLLGCRETIGAGQRHLESRQVAEALRSHGVSREPYEWYLEMRDLAPLQTAGMGMGVERYLMWLLGQSDIRDFMVLLRENGVDHVP